MRITVIIPAAGVGRRFAESGNRSQENTSANKLEAELAGRPVFIRAIEAFTNHPLVHRIIVAANPETFDDFVFRWGDKLGFLGVQTVPGGKADRWETVLKALDAVPPNTTHIAVHDAARPLVTRRLIDRVFDAASRFDAVIPGLRLTGTIKRTVIDETASQRPPDPADAILGENTAPQSPISRVVETVDRAGLVEAQTPQVFNADLLRRAYAAITDKNLATTGITDDASLVESFGETVRVVEGEPTNIKITQAADLPLAEAWVQRTHQTEAAGQARRRLFADDNE